LEAVEAEAEAIGAEAADEIAASTSLDPTPVKVNIMLSIAK